MIDDCIGSNDTSLMNFDICSYYNALSKNGTRSNTRITMNRLLLRSNSRHRLKGLQERS